MAELPTTITSFTMIPGELLAICPSAGSMPIVPSAPVFVVGSHFSPGLGFARRRGLGDDQRTRIVDGERHER